MKLLLSVLLAVALFSVTHGVVISWEESLEGKIDYRFFYLDVPGEDTGVYEKPTFGLINGIESYEYGALGSLYCPQDGISVAVYYDTDQNGKKEWRCLGINILPFASEPTSVSPPLCPPLAPSGIPAIWNSSLHSWECGTYNQILTLATRDDVNFPCDTADFFMYYGYLDEIRCVDPRSIDPALTFQGTTRRSVDAVDVEERVDITNDKKWFNIMSDMDVTDSTNKLWNNWRWSPHMNYDSTSSSSLVPSPPAAIPFASTLLAITVASFKVSSYTYLIAPPSTSDQFTVVVSKLSPALAETVVTGTLIFNSVSATSGQVTFPMTGNTVATASAGEAFVGGVKEKSWTKFSVNSDRHLVALTLWISTSASFTDFWTFV